MNPSKRGGTTADWASGLGVPQTTSPFLDGSKAKSQVRQLSNSALAYGVGYCLVGPGQIYGVPVSECSTTSSKHFIGHGASSPCMVVNMLALLFRCPSGYNALFCCLEHKH